MEKCSVSKATLGRLPRYLQQLKENFESGGYVSATAIAKALSLGEVQVRKDLSSVSGAGRPKIGYAVDNLIESIENTLGCKNLTKAVIVGAGRLGQALLDYEGFEEYGVEISAAFDINAGKTNKPGKEILPMELFDGYCKGGGIKIGIITVNENAAQEVCDKMVKNGIKAIWNFTPKALSTPKGVLVQQESLALSLAHLNNQLVNKNQED